MVVARVVLMCCATSLALRPPTGTSRPSLWRIVPMSRSASMSVGRGAVGWPPKASRPRSIASSSHLGGPRRRASVVVFQGPGIPPEYPTHEKDPTGPAIKGVVLGGGSFGLAMACVLGRNGVPVTLLMRNKQDAEHVNEYLRHPKYLSDLDLPPSTRATIDAADALRDASFLVHCVPVANGAEYTGPLFIVSAAAPGSAQPAVLAQDRQARPFRNSRALHEQGY